MLCRVLLLMLAVDCCFKSSGDIAIMGRAGHACLCKHFQREARHVLTEQADHAGVSQGGSQAVQPGGGV